MGNEHAFSEGTAWVLTRVGRPADLALLLGVQGHGEGVKELTFWSEGRGLFGVMASLQAGRWCIPWPAGVDSGTCLGSTGETKSFAGYLRDTGVKYPVTGPTFDALRLPGASESPVDLGDWVLVPLPSPYTLALEWRIGVVLDVPSQLRAVKAPMSLVYVLVGGSIVEYDQLTASFFKLLYRGGDATSLASQSVQNVLRVESRMLPNGGYIDMPIRAVNKKLPVYPA